MKQRPICRFSLPSRFSILMTVRISGVGRLISASRYASQYVKYFKNIGGIPIPVSHGGHEE
jgi:hypothetical protein